MASANYLGQCVKKQFVYYYIPGTNHKNVRQFGVAHEIKKNMR